MSDRLMYAFLEVSRFDKPQEACNTFEERFLYLMKNLPTFAEEPELWDDPYYKEMMEEAEYAKMTMEQRYQYAMSMKQKWDYQNTLDFAKKNAREEGFAEGREEGREEGQKEGIMENKVKTARRMLAKGYPVDEIAEITEIPADQLKSL